MCAALNPPPRQKDGSGGSAVGSTKPGTSVRLALARVLSGILFLDRFELPCRWGVTPSMQGERLSLSPGLVLELKKPCTRMRV